MFRKILIVALVVMSICALAFAEDVYDSTGTTTSISVPATTTVYTHSFPIDNGEYAAVSYYGSSAAGNAYFTIQLEESFSLPTTEGSTDVTWAIPVNMPDTVTAFAGTEAQWYHTSLPILPLQYGRFKITGTAGNHATDTVVKIKVTQMKSLNVR